MTKGRREINHNKITPSRVTVKLEVRSFENFKSTIKVAIYSIVLSFCFTTILLKYVVPLNIFVNTGNTSCIHYTLVSYIIV